MINSTKVYAQSQFFELVLVLALLHFCSLGLIKSESHDLFDERLLGFRPCSGKSD